MKQFGLVLFALLLCILFPLSAQDDEEWYIGKPIKDFSFVGLKTISLDELRPIVRSYIGKNFTLDLFWEIQGKLFALDYFDKIDADAKPADEGKSSVLIEFKVYERPAVSEIKIEGNRKVSTGSILDKVLIKVGDFTSDATINQDIVNIKNLYIEKGFPDITVEGKTEMDIEKNEAKVIFRINEGSETKIRKIRFSGNNFASEGTLKWQMQTKEQSLFVGGNFQESILQEDKGRIESYYKEHGYIDTKVAKIDRQTERDEENNRTHLIITLYIDEGDQYRYGGMTFEGNQIFSSKEIEDLLRLKVGEVLNTQKVESAYQRVVSLYTDNGYIYNMFHREEIRNESEKTISFHVTIKELDKAHIENIIIQGNQKTKNYVIMRELPFEVGDIFSVEKIRQGVLNLHNLQYFAAIDVKPVTGSATGLMDLIINLEEQSWADFRFAISFSGGDFPIAGLIGFTDNNFLGSGKTIGFDAEASSIRQGVSFNFSDNHLFGRDWGGGLSVSFSHNLIKNVYQDIIPPLFEEVDIPDPYTSMEEYEDALRGGLNIPSYAMMDYNTIDITLGLNTGYFLRTKVGRVGFNTGLSTTLTYLWYNDEIYRPYSLSVRDNLYRWDFINTWGTTLYWDKRDIMHDPTAGFYLSQYFGFTGGFLFGARDYIKLQTRAEAFQTLFRIPVTENFDLAMVLALHSSIAFILPQFGGFFEVTPVELLAIDGMNIGRGWPYQTGYKALWDSSLELRMPLVKNLLGWTWFFDVVGTWPEISTMGNMSIEDYYFSFGAGIRFTIPGLPIRLYLAQTFQVIDGKVDLGTGDFSLGPLGLKFVIAFTRPGGF